jgi:hypothetical protein
MCIHKLKGLPMKKTSKIIIASAASILFAQAAMALSDTNQPTGYSVIALKNCAVVSDKAMTDVQLEAYLSLKQQEQKIHTLEGPIQNIEQEIESYSDNIERLTKLAIQETDESLHINKTLLKQQEAAAKEFAQFMQLHQHKFDALGDQGKAIGQQADIFETSIKANLGGIDYDQIQVLTPKSKQAQQHCDNNIRVMVI